MISSNLRAAAVALMVGTAAIVVSGSLPFAAAYAAGVRPAIGNALKEAEQLAASGNYRAALAKVDEAEGTPNKTAAESSAIEAVKNYVETKSGAGPAGLKMKFAQDYNAGRYRDVIQDGEQLRRAGQLDQDSMRVVAQAYYLSGDKAECIHYIQDNFGSGASEAVLELEMRCAYDAGDNDAERDALEELVARTGKPEYWQQLLKTAERTQGLTDHETLDIYRLKLATGTMSGGDDYRLLAQLALQFHFPGEAVSVMQKGFDAKALSGDRDMRLQNLAKTQAAADAAGFAKAQAAANSAKNGDALVTLGEDEWGDGKFQDAISSVKAGIDKGLTDSANAQIVLGMAYLGAGQKDQAIRAFNAAKGDPRETMIAHLWALYAKK